MKVILFLTSLLAASSIAAPPAAPAPSRPSGRLILLGRQQLHPPPAEGATAATTTTTTTQAPHRDADNEQTEKPDEAESEKLLDAGEYYVLTPEGKLQMVKYTTAALKKPSAAQPAQQVFQQPQPFAQFQVEYFQYPSFQPSAAQKAEEEKEDSEETSGFEAKVQFRDVKPIPAPIYAYNPAPVVRILKK